MSATSTPARVDPLSALDDLGDFQPTSTPKPKPAPELVREVSEAAGFPSRAPAPKPRPAAVAAPASATPPRRQGRRTGRNVQVNVKMTAATAERLAKLSDAHGWAYGETMDHALAALEAAETTKHSR